MDIDDMNNAGDGEADAGAAMDIDDIDKELKEPTDKRIFIKASMLSVLSLYAVKLPANQEKGCSHGSNDDLDTEKYPRTCYYGRGTVTPPGSWGEDNLTNRCIACQACVTNCPIKVMVPTYLEYGFTGMMMPKLDYNIGFCDYDCKRCGEVCPTGAIIPFDTIKEKQRAQMGYVQFRKGHCVVHHDNEECGKCYDNCPTEAIQMVPYENGFMIPEVHPDVCVGCGACEYVCPVEEPHKAIFVTAFEKHRKLTNQLNKPLKPNVNEIKD